MDLYYALTLYHVLCCLVHKMTCNKNPAVLVLSSETVGKYMLKENLEKTDVFAGVLLMEDDRIRRSALKEIDTDRGKFEGTLADSYERFSCVEPGKYENRYLCADHYPTGLYCRVRSIPYYYFEDGNGQQSRKEETIEGIGKNNAVQYQLIRHYGLFGDNECVLGRLVDLAAQREGYSDKKAVDFSVVRQLKKLNRRQTKRVCSVFGYAASPIDGSGGVLYLPQHNVNLGIFTTEEQLGQSGLLLDYFAGDRKVYIKRHPNDCFTDYSLIKGAQIIEGNFPVELMALSVGKNFRRGITAWSTSIHSLSEIIDEKICFSVRIDEDYRAVHSYYAALKMLRESGREIEKALCFGVNIELLHNLIKFCDDFDFPGEVRLIPVGTLKELEAWEHEKNCISVVDDVSVLREEEKDGFRRFWLKERGGGLTVFINTENDAVFYDGTNIGIFGKLCMWTIRKCPGGADMRAGQDDSEERVYLYMEDEIEIERLRHIGYIKELPCCNMVVKANLEDEEYQLPEKREVYRGMKQLEGILIATEQRVLWENRRNRQLQSENEALREKIGEQEKLLRENLPDRSGALEQELEANEREIEFITKQIRLAEQKIELEMLRNHLDGISGGGREAAPEDGKNTEG